MIFYLRPKWLEIVFKISLAVFSVLWGLLVVQNHAEELNEMDEVVTKLSFPFSLMVLIGMGMR